MMPDSNEREILLFGTVIRDSERYRMWYFAHPVRGETDSYIIAYAESTDGIEWQRPNLALLDIAPNAVIDLERWRIIGFAGVIVDPSGCPESKRYKAILSVMERSEQQKTYLLLTSPDGYTWNEAGTFTPDAPAYPDTCCFTWDPFRDRYVLYSRSRFAPADVHRQDSPNFFGRAQSICTSEDFQNWETGPIVMHVTADDLPGTEIYSLMAYPASNGWIGLHQIHRSQPTEGLVDIRFSHSSDGTSWIHTDEIALPNGEPGEWDRFNQSVASSLVTDDAEHRIYYSGRLYRHGEYRRAGYADTGPRSSSIGMATIRRDGWCSLAASFDGGTVETELFPLLQGRMYVNAECRFGEIVVEIIPENGDPFRSLPVRSSGVQVPVMWEQGDSVPSGTQPVRVRFHLTNARFFAWYVEP